MRCPLPSLLTAMITPFCQDESLDEAGLIANVHDQLDAGVQGLLLLGTTGENPTLSLKEREKIIQLGCKHGAPSAHIMVGTGSFSTQVTIEQTLQAQELGAHSALIVTPYYNKPTPKGMLLHFEAIAKATNLPLMVYNNPGRTGQNINGDLLEELAKIPSIIGIKDSSSQITQVEKTMITLARNPSRPFWVYSGDDDMTFAMMALGGHGAISVISNLVPRHVLAMVTAAEQGLFDQARHLHEQLLPLCKAAFLETNPMPIKMAMNLVGQAAGPCRLPLCEVLEATKEKMKCVLSDLKLEKTISRSTHPSLETSHV